MRKILMWVLFLVCTWHLEVYDNLGQIKSRLEVLSNQKEPFLEICSVRVLPVCSKDICHYNLLYETYSEK